MMLVDNKLHPRNEESLMANSKHTVGPSAAVHNKKCYACGEEYAKTDHSAFTLTEMAHYSPETGNLMMVARPACSRCRE